MGPGGPEPASPRKGAQNGTQRSLPGKSWVGRSSAGRRRWPVYPPVPSGCPPRRYPEALERLCPARCLPPRPGERVAPGGIRGGYPAANSNFPGWGSGPLPRTPVNRGQEQGPRLLRPGPSRSLKGFSPPGPALVPDGPSLLAVDEDVFPIGVDLVDPRTAVDKILGRRNVVHVELITSVSARELIHGRLTLGRSVDE